MSGAILIDCLGTWLTAPAATVHIGASGLVFGFATYLVARGLFDRRVLSLAVGLLVLLGVTHGDTTRTAETMARKVHELRILGGERSAAEVGAMVRGSIRHRTFVL